MEPHKRNRKLIGVIKILHIAGIVLLFALTWGLFYAGQFNIGPLTRRSFLVCGLYIIIIIYLNRVYNTFDLGTARVSELVYSQSLSCLIGDGFMYLLMSVMWLKLTNPLPMVALLAVQLVFNIAWSIWANRLYLSKLPPRRAAVVYCDADDLGKIKEVHGFAQKFDVQVRLQCTGDEASVEPFMDKLSDCSVIFAIGLPIGLRNSIIEYSIENQIRVYVDPNIGDVVMAGARHMQMFSVPIMMVRRSVLLPEYAFIKRLLDIVISLVGIIVTSPIMLIVALIIKLYDGGPILYRQKRMTKDARVFTILKFRSMRQDAEGDGVARMSTQNDDRVTPIGRVIRTTRLDELPQLFNILKGDMTIVGPRPERPEIAAQYEAELPSFTLRLQVRAGLTGLAQVYGRYNTEPHEKLLMDLMYINNMSLLEDVKLMLATAKILFMRESTQGVEEGQVTAVGNERARAREKGKRA